MKKTIRVLATILAILFIPLLVQAQPGQPHPDPYSGELSNYQGKWIIDGMTEEDTDWTLEIIGERYHITSKETAYQGDIIFTPGDKDVDLPDTLWLEFGPDDEIEVVLINQAGGLIDVSRQGLFFVKPGNRIAFDEVEDLERYSNEDMIGDWVMDKLWLIVPSINFEMFLTNADIMPGCITGDERLILSFDDGILYQVSEVLESRIPITRYRIRGNGVYHFENPKPITPYVSKFMAFVLPENSNSAFAGQLVINPYPLPDEVDMRIYWAFSRITKAGD